MDIIHSTIVYYNAKGEQHTYKTDAYIDKARFTNRDEVDWKGVNGVVALLHGENLFVIQAGGWTSRRGMFVDMYPSDEG